LSERTGQTLQAGAALQDNRWSRIPEIFAQRIEADDLENLAGKGAHRDRLVVEPGVKALLFQKGQYLGVLSSGTYPLETLRQRHLPSLFDTGVPTTAILIEEGDLEITLDLENLKTQDYQDATANLSFLVQVKGPEAFLTHLLRGRATMTRSDLSDWFSGEVRAIVAGYIGSRTVENFMSTGTARQKVEDELRLEMNQPLLRYGLEMIRLRFVQFSCPEYEEKILRPTAELDIEDERQQLRERQSGLKQKVQELENQDFIQHFQGQKDLQEYVTQVEHETGLKNLLRTDETAGSEFDLDKNNEARRQALERMKLELQMETLRIESKLKGELNTEEFERQLRHERLELEQRLSNEKLQYMENRAIEMQKESDRLSTQLSAARNSSEIATIEREQDRLDAEQGLMLLAKQKEIKRLEERENQMLQLEVEERRAKLKAESLVAASSASLEALIATSEGAAADRLTQIQELKSKSAMSAEQLMALAAAQSPEAAQAMGEKFKAEATSPAQQMALLQEFMQRQDVQRHEEADRLERVMGHAMGQLGAAAQAGAARPDAPRFMPDAYAAANANAGFPPGVKKVMVCSKCEMENPMGSSFCKFCGGKIG